MKIQMRSKNIELTSTIEEYISTKVNKLTRYYDRIEQAEVVVEKSNRGFITEIIARVEHHDSIVSNHDDPDLHASIDGCIDRSVRQLTDLKTRLQDQKRSTPSGGKDS